MSRMPDDRNDHLGRDASESEDDRAGQYIDAPETNSSPARSSRPKSDASSVIRGRRRHA